MVSVGGTRPGGAGCCFKEPVVGSAEFRAVVVSKMFDPAVPLGMRGDLIECAIRLTFRCPIRIADRGREIVCISRDGVGMSKHVGISGQVTIAIVSPILSRCVRLPIDLGPGAGGDVPQE